MEQQYDTDLALEAAESLFSRDNINTLPGVLIEDITNGGCQRHCVTITNPESGKKLGKLLGKYVTLDPEAFLNHQPESFCTTAEELAEALRFLLPPLEAEATVLVVGLGNEKITPDALGPLTIRNIFVTRHLCRHLPEHFGEFRPVAALETGVLATTGMETVETLSAICSLLHPKLVIAVDALACSGVSRLCNTVQLTDTGISPGGGVGNRQATLNQQSLGIPVIAIGVPTVISAQHLIQDAATLSRPSPLQTLIVTPRDIDEKIQIFARLLGYGISLALQPGLSLEDLELFLS